MIEVQGLTKRFGSKTVVDDLTFQVADGTVTGFLGPNGSGKSTTMRCMLSLDRPAAGITRFNGKLYGDLAHPLREVGALLDAKYVHPSRTARNHLRYLAASNGIAKARVDEVLDLVGMTSVANKKVGKFSLGMHQRLGIAVALLGDPHTMLFDEPVNGLDPEGILWVRHFLRYLAAQGRTVLVSSHLLSEMAQTADNLVVIGQGKLISSGSVSDFVDANVRAWVSVRSPQAGSLASMLRGAGAEVTEGHDGALAVVGVTPAEVGEMAARHGVVLHELGSRQASLEEAFMEATRSSQEYRAADFSTAGSGDMPSMPADMPSMPADRPGPRLTLAPPSIPGADGASVGSSASPTVARPTMPAGGSAIGSPAAAAGAGAVLAPPTPASGSASGSSGASPGTGPAPAPPASTRPLDPPGRALPPPGSAGSPLPPPTWPGDAS